MTLPIELLIDDDVNSTLEVDKVALVDRPAIEVNWFAFADQVADMNFTEVNDEKRIVFGPAMIPGKVIPRVDEETGEQYSVVFSRDTVEKCALKFFQKNFQHNSNKQHDPNQPVKDIVFFQSFVKDSSKGMVGMNDNHPDGTWYLGAKINDDATWQEVKDGKYKGFSVEGMFKYKKQKMSAEEAFKKIMEILNGIEE